jgi:hypothetical protein
MLVEIILLFQNDLLFYHHHLSEMFQLKTFHCLLFVDLKIRIRHHPVLHNDFIQNLL